MTQCYTCNKTLYAHRFVTDLKSFCSKACQCRNEPGSAHPHDRKYCLRCHVPDVPKDPDEKVNRRPRRR